jgi:hypothetical protein
MNTLSAPDGKEMSTTVNRCSHLDEHNISQEMSKDILQRVNDTPHSTSSLLKRSKTNSKHVTNIRQPDGVGVVTKQLQVAAATDPKYCSEYADTNVVALL